jgi:hypothetical protein
MDIRATGIIKITRRYIEVNKNFDYSLPYSDYVLDYEWTGGEVIAISLEAVNNLFGYDFEGMTLYDQNIEDTLYSIHNIGPYKVRFVQCDYVRNIIYATRYSFKGEVIHYWLRFRIALYWKYMHFLYWLSIKGLAEYRPPEKQPSWRNIPILQKTIGRIWKEKTEEEMHQELLRKLSEWKIKEKK